MRKKEKKKDKDQKMEKKKENTWTPFFTRSSQTNEAIKKCETSAVQLARRHSTVHKHNSGHGVEGEGMAGPGECNAEEWRGEGNLSLGGRE